MVVIIQVTKGLLPKRLVYSSLNLARTNLLRRCTNQLQRRHVMNWKGSAISYINILRNIRDA